MLYIYIYIYIYRYRCKGENTYLYGGLEHLKYYIKIEKILNILHIPKIERAN